MTTPAQAGRPWIALTRRISLSRRGSLFYPLFGLLLLAGCAGGGPPEAPGGESTAAPAPGIAPGTTSGTTPGTTPGTAPGTSGRENREIAAAPAKITLPVEVAPLFSGLAGQSVKDRLFGLDGRRVTSILGAPDFIRRDAPAEIWQFRGRTCILDVFFFARNDTARVNHVEFRGRSIEKVSEADCLADLHAVRGGRGDG